MLASGGAIAENDVHARSAAHRPRIVHVQGAPVGESDGLRGADRCTSSSIAGKMDRQLTHRSAARSVTAMAAMLAHEVKNPLSGIRGAAQLLEQDAAPTPSAN